MHLSCFSWHITISCNPVPPHIVVSFPRHSGFGWHRENHNGRLWPTDEHEYTVSVPVDEAGTTSYSQDERQHCQHILSNWAQSSKSMHQTMCSTLDISEIALYIHFVFPDTYSFSSSVYLQLYLFIIYLIRYSSSVCLFIIAFIHLFTFLLLFLI